MLFTSFQFAVEFPLILITYYLLPRRNWQVVFLVIVGMLMYGIENWQFFLLLCFSAAFTGVTSYLASQPERPTRRGWLVAGVVTSLFILIFFKYKGLIFSSHAPSTSYQRIGHPRIRFAPLFFFYLFQLEFPFILSMPLACLSTPTVGPPFLVSIVWPA